MKEKVRVLDGALETAKTEKTTRKKVIETLHARVENLNKQIPNIEEAEAKTKDVEFLLNKNKALAEERLMNLIWGASKDSALIEMAVQSFASLYTEKE